MRYTIQKSLLGQSVKFRCPKCNSGLSASLSEAGNQDACPDCRTPFIVPGIEERQRSEAEKQQRRNEAAAAKESARQAKEAKRAEREAAKERQQEFATARIVDQSPPIPAQQTRPAMPRQQQQQAQQPALWKCPYCGGIVPAGVQKCGHCGEWLQGTGHSDAVAGCLGFALGPIGFFYKGQFAVGFAWIAAIFIIMTVTAGLAIFATPLFWIAMGIHAATIKGRR